MIFENTTEVFLKMVEFFIISHKIDILILKKIYVHLVYSEIIFTASA